MPEGSARYRYQIDPNDELTTASRVLRMVGSGKHVLELGTAVGSMTYALKEYNHCSVVGVEVDPVSAEMARPYCEKLIIGNLDALDLAAALGDEKFDVIVAADVLEHLVDPWACLKKLKPLLKPDGYLVASFPNVAHNAVIAGLLDGRFPYQEKGLLDRTHLRFFARHDLEQMFLATGFIPKRWQQVLLPAELSEFSGAWLSLPEKSQELLRQNENGWCYQFVVQAYPNLETDWVEKVLADLEQSRSDLAQTKAELEGARSELEQTKVELKDGQSKLEKTHAELNETRAELEIGLIKSTHQLQEKEKLLEQIFASTSWKITRPFRWLGIKIKGMRSRWRKLRDLVERNGGISGLAKKIFSILKREGVQGITSRGLQFLRGKPMANDSATYQKWIQQFDTLGDTDLLLLKKKVEHLTHAPLISILIPVYNTPEKWLRRAIESIQKQIYPHWELCLADDASTVSHVRVILDEYQQLDPRIKVVYRSDNGHISAASNSALEVATGEFVALLDHDDELPPHALYWIAKEIIGHPDAALIYSDEDKIDSLGQRSDPYFKPDWNPDLFLAQNYISHLGVYRAETVRAVGGFRVGLEGSQDYDLALRVIERLRPEQIRHIPRVLYHWRVIPGSTAMWGVSEKPYLVRAALQAIREHLSRRGIPAVVTEADDVTGMYRVRYALPENQPLVTLIIPTRNGFNLLHRCIESIYNKTHYSNYEILIVDNGSDDPATVAYLKNLAQSGRATVLRDDRPFNYAALNNNAVQHARGSVIGLLNDDVEVINGDWLGEMVSHALRPEIGAVGARLWYPDNTLQHGGVILVGGVAGHAHKRLPLGAPGYFRRAVLIQNFSAVTAACMVLRKEVFLDAGGFDEDLRVAFNDVDLCLRIWQRGYHNLWTPYAELYHYESATRGHEDTPQKQERFYREIEFMKQRWGALLLNDPAYSPNLTLDREDFSLAWPPRVSREY